MTIKDVLTKINEPQLFDVLCTVLSVDKNTNTVDVEPLNGEAELVDIPLQAEKGKGYVAYPVVGSVVVVSYLTKDDGYVSKMSAIESYILETETDSLQKLITDLIDIITQLKVTTNSGVSINVVNIPELTQLKNRVTKFFPK